MFIGRANELSQMQSLYDTNGFQCMIIWGRRRVGKTTLINEFVKDKPTIYFMATKSTAKDNLESFSQSIAEFHGISHDIAPNYSSFEQALNAIYEISKKQRLILVIDEYPYLAKAYKPISSLLQKLIDLQFKKDSQLYIILCGSSMSFMEKQVLGYQSPLYGRRTGQLQINPFDFYEYKNYYQNFSQEELAIVYGITGGIPQYMFFFNDQLSLQENIIKNFLMHFQQIGRWWGTNPKLKRQEEIDIVAVNDNYAIVAECKWRNEKTDENVLFTLLERATLLSYPQKHYYIFSKSGFTDKCKQAAKINNVHLITYQDMLK